MLLLSPSSPSQDIGDDLVDYEDDIAENGFNIYRAFVREFGTQAPAEMIKLIHTLEAEHERRRLCLTDAQRSAIARRRETAAKEPGCGAVWAIPPPIFE